MESNQGFSPDEKLRILHVVADATAQGAPVESRRVADLLRCPTTSTQFALQRLEQEGLLQKPYAFASSSLYYVELTESGRRLLAGKAVPSGPSRQGKVGSPSKTDKQAALKVFISYASDDRDAVRAIFKRLKRAVGFHPWLDCEDILPGQVWKQQVTAAVRSADVVVVCISRRSIGKTGYLQKEIKEVLDFAAEHPDEMIFVIPARLEECQVPERLRQWQWVDLFEKDGFGKLTRALRARAEERLVQFHHTSE